MFNIIKKNLEKFTFVTHDEMIYEYFKVSEGHKYYPEWWKELDTNLYADDLYNNSLPRSSSNKVLTTKSCPGITDLYKNSFVMPLWCEIDLNVTENYVNAKVSDQMTKIESHGSEQRGSFLDSSKYQHIKINTPWLVETKSNIKFLICACMFSNENLINGLYIPNGIRSFDISASTNIHGFVKKEDRNINLKAGSAMLHLFALTDKKIQIKCEFDPEKYRFLNNTQPGRFSFTNSYYTKKKIMQKRL